MAWERLELTYGPAEAIENALFKRIDSFPEIMNQDGPKLTKLGDLLKELQAAKAEEDFPGLAFLDTARGVTELYRNSRFVSGTSGWTLVQPTSIKTR